MEVLSGGNTTDFRASIKRNMTHLFISVRLPFESVDLHFYVGTKHIL